MIKKNFKGRPKFALFCSYCSSHGHTKGRCFKRPRRESIPRPKEKTFYGHMRNNQNLPNRRIDSNNVNGRQLPSTSPVYNSSRSRTPYRSQLRNNYNNTSNYNRNNDSNNNYNSRNTSYNRNNFNRSRTNSYNRNNSYNRYNNSRSNSRYTNRSQSRHQSPYNRNYNNNNCYNKQRFDSRDSNKNDRYRQRSNSINRHYSNNNNRNDRRNSSHREQNNRHQSKDGRTDGNRYNNNHNKGRINNVETDRPNEDPPGIDEYEYTSESSNGYQEILEKFYNANEDTCNTIVNALESNPTCILHMYQCNKFEQDFTKQKPILIIDFLLDSGATLNLLNEDTWNEIKYNNPEIHLERANKTLTSANNTTIETFGTMTLNLTPDRISNNRNKIQHNFNFHFYVTQCNHSILGTPFFKECIETINVNTNKLTINTNRILDNDITFFMNSTKGYPFLSTLNQSTLKKNTTNA